MDETLSERAERLASVFARRGPDGNGSISGVIYGEVAATLRALAAENEAIWTERDAAKIGAANNWQHYLDFKYAFDRAEGERDAALARVRRLEGALQKIASSEPWSGRAPLARIASAAIADTAPASGDAGK